MEIDWLADTGSPRSFMQESTAKKITANYPKTSIAKYTEKKTKYKCFNNQDIQLKGVLNVNIKSGSWSASNCKIIRLEKCSDEYLISSVVITVKKDKSVKIALDSKELNDAIHKKTPMQSIDHLVDAVVNYTSERSTNGGSFYFTKRDLKYAYSQIPLGPQLQKHCNSNILGGKATGTYRFLNSFHGLIDMLATFQKTIDVTLRNCHNNFAFLDDILVITKGNLTDHEKEIEKILYLLDKENLS